MWFLSNKLLESAFTEKMSSVIFKEQKISHCHNPSKIDVVEFTD